MVLSLPLLSCELSIPVKGNHDRKKVVNDINECHKKPLFRCCRGRSLLGDIFKRYLSVTHKARLVTHGKTEKIARSVLCHAVMQNIHAYAKQSPRKDIIFDKQFRAPTIYCQVLIFVDKFC